MPKKDYLSPNQEKERYDTHNNDVNDLGYQRFVLPIVQAVCNQYVPASVGLDFGSGPGPVVSKLLTDQGYKILQFDPFFANNPEVLKLKYDYIVACEVVEHFYDPLKEFQLLFDLLHPGGKLFCMTHIYTPDIPFKNWYYKNDKTHVFIFQHPTLLRVKELVGFADIHVNGRLIEFTKGLAAK